MTPSIIRFARLKCSRIIRGPRCASASQSARGRSGGVQKRIGNFRGGFAALGQSWAKKGPTEITRGVIGANEGNRTLIHRSSHLPIYLCDSAIEKLCLAVSPHQSERKRITTGSKCAKNQFVTSVIARSSRIFHSASRLSTQNSLFYRLLSSGL